MKDIEINVNKARLRSFAVNLREDGSYDISCNLDMMCNDRVVSSYNAGTESWKDNRLKPSFEIGQSIIRIGNELENQTIQCLNNEFKKLEAPKVQEVEPDEVIAKNVSEAVGSEVTDDELNQEVNEILNEKNDAININ